MDRQITRGDIFYIHKEKVCGSEQIAGRPAIVVSNDLCNQTSETIEVVYLTTRHKSMLPTHVVIKSTGKGSTALCEQITTVSVERVGDYRGHISAEESEAVDEAMRISIGLKKIQALICDEANNATSIQDLIQKLAAALAERDVYKQMYTDLLERMMNGR